jgi:hypothetical protein
MPTLNACWPVPTIYAKSKARKLNIPAIFPGEIARAGETTMIGNLMLLESSWSELSRGCRNFRKPKLLSRQSLSDAQPVNQREYHLHRNRHA